MVSMRCAASPEDPPMRAICISAPLSPYCACLQPGLSAFSSFLFSAFLTYPNLLAERYAAEAHCRGQDVLKAKAPESGGLALAACALGAFMALAILMWVPVHLRPFCLLGASVCAGFAFLGVVVQK